MRIPSNFAAAALGLVVLAGCGGGASPGGDPAPSGSAGVFGQIQTRGQVNGQPLVRDLAKVSTVGLAGVLTDATYRPEGTPDNGTAIVYATAGSIDSVMEDGQFVESWKPPVASPLDYYLLPSWTADGSKLFYMAPSGIYYTTPENPKVSTRVIASTGIGYFALSPDATKVTFTRIPEGETDREVFVRDVAGGPTKRLTDNAVDDDGTVWVDNEQVAVRTISMGEDGGTHTIRVSDMRSQDYLPYSSGVFPVARSQNGIFFLNSAANDPGTAGISVSNNISDANFGYKDYLGPSLDAGGAGSISPDGQRWAFSARLGFFTTELYPVNLHQLPLHGTPDALGMSWQPALGTKKFVGTGGSLGASSAGIIATRRSGPGRNGLSSFLSWDCQTRSTSTISDDATELGAGSKTYIIEADRLTALKFANRPFFNPVSTLESASTANGAIVSVDAETGIVDSILIYKETRGAKPTIRREGDAKVVEGHLLGVWDAKGKNLAPNGASRVTLPASGEPQL
ncbi:hypothetical protein EON81_04730 [bacterium]|nr:MAG: hypothetical protein EON81_04730 [bacterium]